MLAFNAIAPLAQAMENTTYAAQAAWLCRGPTLLPDQVAPDRGAATITQTRVGKVNVNGPGGALATWVTNEDGTILGMRSGEGEISLDEEWGPPSSAPTRPPPTRRCSRPSRSASS